MKLRHAWPTLVLGLGLALAGCGPENQDEGRPMARVGEYVFTEKAFKERAAEWAYFRGLGVMSEDDKRALLEQEVDKEVLIQEAVRRGLHEEDSFRKTIENYWEQTLVTALLKRKEAELKNSVIVTEQEVKDRYEARKKDRPDLPALEEMAEEIQQELGEEKKTQALEKWIQELRSKTEVVVYEDNLKAVR